jgi:hypothetical protein
MGYLEERLLLSQVSGKFPVASVIDFRFDLVMVREYLTSILYLFSCAYNFKIQLFLYFHPFPNPFFVSFSF